MLIVIPFFCLIFNLAREYSLNTNGIGNSLVRKIRLRNNAFH